MSDIFSKLTRNDGNSGLTMIRFCICAVLLASVAAPRTAQAAAFEDIGVGARGRGLAGTFAAIADDVSSVYWNPAGLSSVSRDEVQAFYQDLYGLGLVNYSFVGYVRPFVGRGTVGFGWTRMGTSASVDFMDYSENTFIFSYGRRFGASLSLGASLKYFSVAYDTKASGLGIDLGARYALDDRLTLALVLQNVNTPQIRWETLASDSLPLHVRLGAGYAVADNHTVAVEVNQDAGEDAHLSAGWEGWFLNRLLGLRAGGVEQNDRINLAGGASIGYRSVRLDYTLEQHPELGYSSLVSFSLVF